MSTLPPGPATFAPVSHSLPIRTSDGRKAAGAYFTPAPVAGSLVRWAVRVPGDRLLDPSCGDGAFLTHHAYATGVERDVEAAATAGERTGGGVIHVGDFFTWAEWTASRFDCAAGNPPFIRYQRFSGATREAALRICRRAGVAFSGLASSWAPFLVATALLLKPGGRLAFVVPAEIGHAPYAAPLIEFLVAHFAIVHVVAIRNKLYPSLSEDCWILYADGYGARTDGIRLSEIERFVEAGAPPAKFETVPVAAWTTANRRLRTFLMPALAREAYHEMLDLSGTRRLGDIAHVGIGYLTGANDFFHVRPSQAATLGIPKAFLRTSVRNGRALRGGVLDKATVAGWLAADDPVLLLHLPRDGALPKQVRDYLDGEDGQRARTAYKCRVRKPWHAVPGVTVPDYVLTVMAGRAPVLARNDAGCAATNSLLALRLRWGGDGGAVMASWGTAATMLSCEVEGHPLGGGMLKLEPGEAARIAFPSATGMDAERSRALEDGLRTLRKWRHLDG